MNLLGNLHCANMFTLYALTFGYLWTNCANVRTKPSFVKSLCQWKHLRSIPHHKYRRIGHWILCICTSDPCCNMKIEALQICCKHHLIPQFTLQTIKILPVLHALPVVFHKVPYIITFDFA